MKRRIAVVLLGALVLAMGSVVEGQAASAYTRKSILRMSPSEAEAYRNVVRAMKALPVEDPRSWLYQSGIHLYVTPAVVSTLPDPPFTAADRAEMTLYALTPPQHAVQNATWAQCHLSDPDRIFLLWHRIYLHYFERIARKISNQPDFALPYWDYTKGTSQSDNPLRLPEPFRDETYIPPAGGAALPNPLYAVRDSLINAGEPLDPALVTLSALNESTFDGFSQSLENAPHNVIHGAIGKANTLLMGATVWAAQDPIFWLHHTNIDRLWSCWERRGNQSGPHEDSGPYVFINEDGALVTLTVAQMEDLAATIDYEYEEYEECQPAGQPPLLMAAEAAVPLRLEAFSHEPATGVVLGAQPTVVPVKVGPFARQVMNMDDVRERREQFDVQLRLSGIQSDRATAALYKVNIRPKGADGQGTTVGVIGFFGKGEAALQGGRAHGHEPGGGGASIQFTLSDTLLRSQPFAGNVPDEFEILFVPTSGLRGGDNVSQKIDQGARPRVGSIRLIVLGRSLPRLDQ